MGRKTRQHYPGAIFHFIARGNNRQEIFLDDRDRRSFERILDDGVQRFGHLVHVFCWMANHVHMTVQVSDVPLSKIAHNLLFRYARWFNWRHGRTGHLFEGRHRAFPVRSTAALQGLARYIHLNPVRAGIVESPEEYPWSSYPSYVGRPRPARSWLTTDLLLSLFADTRARAIADLMSFTESEGEMSSGEEGQLTSRGEVSASGAPEFDIDLEWHRDDDSSRCETITVEEVLDAVCSLTGAPRADLAMETQRRVIVRARSFAAWLVSRAPHLTLQELAGRLHRDASTLSRAATTIDLKLRSDPETRMICRTLEEVLQPKQS